VRALVRLSIVLIGMVLCLPAAPATAQTADDLFSIDTIHDLRLFINSRDLQQLRQRFDENTYYAADLQWRNVRVRNVAVRSRGFSSRSSTKLGLRVDMNRFTSRQRFVGLTSLVLDNLWHDPSQMRERLGMAVFKRMGHPASRVSFARLYINSVYQGLYAIVEPVDAQFVLRTLGLTDGYLFQYKWIREYFGEYLGDDLAPYKQMFEAETHRLASDTVLYSPIRDLLREVNQPHDAQWREIVERYLDLEQLVSYVAVETFLSESDGVAGFWGMANFFLYRPEQTTRHRLLTWDRDRAFEQIDSPIFARTEQNVLVQRALAFPDLRARYLDVLEECARAAAEDGWLEQEVDTVTRLITTAAHEDVRKQFSSDEFDAQVLFLREFAKRRPVFVASEVARERAAAKLPRGHRIQ
jgi:spore coat protein CotH